MKLGSKENLDGKGAKGDKSLTSKKEGESDAKVRKNPHEIVKGLNKDMRGSQPKFYPIRFDS